jgi:putative oxidoreductase
MNYKVSKREQVVTWIAQLVAAAIMLQTLYFKFTGAEESKYIFASIGIEPWGRYGTGIAELVASILLFVPKYVWMGASLTFGLMTGAIFVHLTIIGIAIEMDHGTLFDLAILTWICSLIILYISRTQISFFVQKYKKIKE